MLNSIRTYNVQLINDDIYICTRQRKQKSICAKDAIESYESEMGGSDQRLYIRLGNEL